MGEQVFIDNRVLRGGYYEILSENSCENINKRSIIPFIGCESDVHNQGAMQRFSEYEKPFDLASLSDQELYEAIMRMPKHKLVAMHSYASAARKLKYPVKQVVRSVNLPRSFTEEQLVVFFQELRRFKNNRVFTAFLLALLYGLRVSEIAHLCVVPKQGLVCIYDVKMRRKEYLPLISGTEAFIDFYRSEAPLSKDYLRKYFRETCARLGDEFMYAEPGVLDQQCHQFTTHSLRHTAGAFMQQYTGVEYKVHVFLRHNVKSIYGSTGYYLHYRIEDMRSDVHGCFLPLFHRLVD